MPIPSISTFNSAILFNLIIFDSTGSELDKMIDASFTSSFINLLGSFAFKGLNTNKIKFI